MTSVWWYVARSAGLVAWGLAAASVLWGLFLSTRVLGNRPRANWLLDLHRFLGGLTIAFIGVHILGLVLDPFVQFGTAQVLVPFASTWNPLAVAWGVVAMYLLVAVEVSSLMRRRLPKRWWRGIHMASYAVYALGTIHLLTAGTDRHSTVLLWTVAIVTGAVACMTIYRMTAPKKSNPSARDTLRARQPVG